MRVLILAAVLACAAAAPSGLLAAPWGHGLIGHAAPLAISHGDIQGAAIDAHVVASDHVRANVDATREIQGQQINAGVEHTWRAIDASLTHRAAADGHAAGVAPIVAKQIVGHGYAAPLAVGYGAHGLAGGYLGGALAGPLAYGHGLGW